MRMAMILLLFLAISRIIPAKIISDTAYLDDDDDDDDDDDEGQDVTQQEENESEDETEENPPAETESTPVDDEKNNMADEDWLNTAVKDIAFYLRAHKFNDFDRRHHLNEDTAPRTFFKEFPDPPLRTLHWEVRKYCELGFQDCVQYLHEKVLEATFRRNIDTLTVSRENNWSRPNNTKQIEEADKECQRLRKLDWVTGEPFVGPLERFQWRTSASYYMCMFTMREEPSLAAFGELCDNFANCLDPDFGDSNGDPRADDRLPFQCATYSFCPDTCCPRKHYSNLEECWHDDNNPCHEETSSQCSFDRLSNTDFVSIALNRWNVSCICDEVGYKWDSRFGICIDVDECVQNLHSCSQGSEACFNVAGSYMCGCQWGYLFDTDTQQCVQNDALIAVETEASRKHTSTEVKPVSITKMIAGWFSKSAGTSGTRVDGKIMKTCMIAAGLIGFAHLFNVHSINW